MKKIISLFFIVLFIGGCGHTNELLNFDLRGKNAYFEEFVARNARTIQVEMNTPKSKEDEKDDKDDVVGILEAVVSASSAVLSAEKISDIKDYVNTYDLVASVTDGFMQALETYVDIKTVDDPKLSHFIVETELERCVLYVSKDNVHVTVQANTKIIDIASGVIVWENWESDTIPLDNVTRGVKVKKGTGSRVLTALQLASLSKKEVNACVGEAAEYVGRKMGDTFREDLAEARQGR